MKAHNPILRGFYPDPSIVRVGEDYYMVNSTFFWWPGVTLHHSRDLVHWEQLPYPLDRISQLDLRGVSAAGGVWAPDLSYADGRYYLLYTNVRSMYTCMYDTANFLVTSKNICGPWSDPVPLSRFGFDPSLFHDDDGKKYMISMVTDHRRPPKYNGRLIVQEYDPESRKMSDEIHEVYQGEIIYLEGPHLLKHGGWYYIFAADTGTGEGHGQSLLRSRSVFGPYEMYMADFMQREGEQDAWSLLTTRYCPDYPIQKCGHCCLTDTVDGAYYAVHLCGRPTSYRNPEDWGWFPGERRYPLGRETAIQKMEWTDDGWLRLANHTNLPETDVEIAGLKPHPFPADSARDDFDENRLRLAYQSPHIAQDESHLSLTARRGYLRMYGRDGLASKFDQTMIARRWTEFSFDVSCELEFEPEHFKQMAGLILLYDLENFLYLHVTKDEDIGTCLAVMQSVNKEISCPAKCRKIPERVPVFLKAEVRDCMVQFFFSIGDEHSWQKFGGIITADYLSDEACDDGWFSGAMAGICCQDLTGNGKWADFDWFEYQTDV